MLVRKFEESLRHKDPLVFRGRDLNFFFIPKRYQNADLFRLSLCVQDTFCLRFTSDWMSKRRAQVQPKNVHLKRGLKFETKLIILGVT